MLELVRETGVTILVVTHDLGLAWNIADRIAVMYLGRIVDDQVIRVTVRAQAQARLRRAVGLRPADHVSARRASPRGPRVCRRDSDPSFVGLFDLRTKLALVHGAVRNERFRLAPKHVALD